MRISIKDIRSDLQISIKDVRSDLQNFHCGVSGLYLPASLRSSVLFLWDRRTAFAPAIRKNQELEERENKVESALKEYAEKEPRLKEALKHAGLM